MTASLPNCEGWSHEPGLPADGGVIGIGAATAMFIALAVLIAFGVQVAIALGVVSLAAIYSATGSWQEVSRLVAATAYDGLRADIVIAIPLLMLMGEFIARSGAVTDVFRAASRALTDVSGGPALAAGVGNALSAFVAGSSSAGAAGFTRVSYDELRRCGADRAASLGTLAGASTLGMLLPPSVLMVTWGILTRQPVEAIFLAMLAPAVLVVVAFAVSVRIAGTTPNTSNVLKDGPATASSPRAWTSLIGIAAAFAAVLVGIATRLLSVAEAASLGAAIGLAMALGKDMRPGVIVEAILVVGRASAPILLLIFAAMLYAQALAVTGAGAAVQAALAGLGAAAALSVMIAIWLVLVTVLDALSAAALTAALFVPAASTLGIDPLALAVIGILVLEGAPLVPPLGLLVFTTRAAAGEGGVPMFDIFRHVLPMLAILMVVILLVAIVPRVAISLPYLVG